MKKRIKLMKKYFKKSQGKVNHTVDAYIEETMGIVQERSQRLLLLDDLKVSKPFVISTPNVANKKNVRFKVINLGVKDEHRVDYNYASVNTVILGEKSLFYHQADVDFIMGHVDRDVTGEVALKDIVQLQTMLDYNDPKTPTILNLSLKITLVGGESIQIPLRKHFMHDGYTYPEVLTTKERYIIQTVKEAIRSVK